MSARRRITLAAAVLLLLVVTLMEPALAATRYVGNSRSRGYGVKGYVGTPAQQPILYDWVCSWVSTSGPDWVQTGWAMYPGWAYPKSYVEASVGSSYDRIWYSDQAYGYARLYEVCYTGSNGQWRALIQGSSRGVWGPISAPREMQACSEVLNNFNSQLNATFSSIQYKGLYSYMLFDEDNRLSESPYWIDFPCPYQYYSHGNGM